MVSDMPERGADPWVIRIGSPLKTVATWCFVWASDLPNQGMEQLKRSYVASVYP